MRNSNKQHAQRRQHKETLRRKKENREKSKMYAPAFSLSATKKKKKKTKKENKKIYFCETKKTRFWYMSNR